ARTSVPSALTCRLTRPSAIARFTVSSNNRSRTPDSSNRRRRFWLNVEASHGCWSRFRPTNQRRAMLHYNSTTSLRSLVHSKQIAADQRQEQLLGRNRRTADGGVQVAAEPTNHAIVDERADCAQRMIVGHERFQRDVVEERPLRIALSHHRGAPPLLHT